MWGHYNYTNFPIIEVKCIGSLRNNNDYEDFTNKWTSLYNDKKKFKFIFDTKECGYVNIKYAFSMVSFIRKLKQLPEQYLESSVIIYNSKWIKFLLQFIFWCQSPVAPVYLVNGNVNREQTIELLNKNIILDNVIVYLP